MTNRVRSLWLDGLRDSLAPRPALDGDARCDVAIVGAGFTGLWTAYALKRARPGLSVLVLEREIAGFGASGRNGGWASGGIAGRWATYARRAGEEAVRAATRATFRAVDEIGEAVAREAIDCGFAKGGSLALATTRPQLARLERDLAEARAHGLREDDLRWLEPGELPVRAEGALGATFTPHCARVDPARLVRGLAAACERLGVVLHEETEALELAPGRVRCRSGTVTAGHVLRATEAYTAEPRRYLPLFSLMIATEPLPGAVWGELGWPGGLTVRDRRHLFFYAQRTADGRIAIGGRGAPYALRRPLAEEGEHDEGVRGRLAATLARTFPAAAGAAITHHWGGPLAVPRDWSMGVVYDARRRTGWAGGYAGHGVVASHLAGRTLADLVLGRDSELVRLPWVGHASRRWEPEPLRYLASKAIVGVLGSADRLEDATGRPARRAALLRPLLP